jgi:hypothetical protein
MLKKNISHLSFICGTLAMIMSSVVVTVLTTSCDRDKSPTSPPPINFKATAHIIGSSGETMRLSVQHYHTYYSLSADTSKIDQTDRSSFLVNKSEMKLLASSLSDTMYFNWKFMTAVTPYPQEDCVLFVYLNAIEDYMCTLGSGKTAANTLQNLVEPLSGDARNILDSLVTTLRNE